MAGYDKVQGNSAKTRHCHQLAANMPCGIADWWKASNEGQVSRDETFSRQNQLHILSAIFPGKLLPGVTDAAKKISRTDSLHDQLGLSITYAISSAARH